jgi:two-component system KDP operon response regulator KdpE
MNAASTNPRILVIDDEAQIRRLLRVTLESGGFDMSEANSGRSGLSEAAALQPDGIILDLGLPDLAGIDVLRQLREWSQVPVLVLTVRDRAEDKTTVLDAGADDYLTKPFNGSELMARLRAIMRRARSVNEPPIICFGDIEFDQPARIVRRQGKDIHLTTREYALLRLLVLHRGKVVTHRQILRELWGPNSETDTNYLRVYMNHLRQKLENEPSNPMHLLTEAGIGYRLIE